MGAPEPSVRELRRLENPSSACELRGIGLLCPGLSFEKKNEGWNSALQVLQHESLEFGLLCNSEKLLWHQDIGGVKVRLYKNTPDWMSK